MKTSIRLLLTALAITGVTFAAAGTPLHQQSAAASLAFHDR